MDSRSSEETSTDMNARLFTFVGGEIGPWRVADIKPVIGEALADVKRLNVVNGAVPVEPDATKWLLLWSNKQ